jgi:glycosyltransferase involved in cell wall biosynthesis
VRIYYEGSIYGIYRARPGGITNFFDHLISRISMKHKCLLTTSRPSYLPHPSGSHLEIARHVLQFRPQRINQFLERKYFSFRARQFAPSLIHYTYYSDSPSWQLKLPLVYTAYDMIHEKWSSQLDPIGKQKDQKLRCFERATAISCISESTRNDLLQLYPHLETKTSVIYLAGDLKSQPRHSQASLNRGSKPSYLLYVGARASYKNFVRLLLAFSRLASRYNWIRLKVVGAPFEGHEIDLIESLGLESKIISYPDLTDGDLYALYSRALAFIYPSLYEGFGIPLLEAMALNCPVLAADVSSIPEVTGDAALLFNPRSIDAIYEAIVEIIRRPGLREELIEKGRRRINYFGWEKTAAQYLNLYDRVVHLKRKH